MQLLLRRFVDFPQTLAIAVILHDLRNNNSSNYIAFDTLKALHCRLYQVKAIRER